ncbi:3-hydroxyacyl-CoA dehydrogenase [Natronococcus pandeyae]|uniref:enoyl-CoA hydratase n=1 Tax=Natronococcus pandeyae TaxID=2055836 RepID=A0A8J8Q419_9EURY|nr:3-hydroxyacyl-CoA dehydrogenase NAD-binding domain-containing protein [Natronococcus pandeyae]TYL37334.1 3-hydroxyacyl-CoA dehydrogenase [Natronococcus pandeyae]
MAAPSLEDIETVTVIGAGSMGHGIAQVFAMHRYDVTLVDIEEEPLSTALENIEQSLERLGEEPGPVLDRITTTTDRNSGLSDTDLMVEATPEDIDLKRDVFAAADEAAPEHAILATNTSTLPVTEMADATDRPEQVVGMHFSNPVPLIDLVEVISGEQTSDSVIELTVALSEDVGKTPVILEKDVPGFLLNRINYAFWSEGLRHLDDGRHDAEAIDASIRRLGFPMGPFEVLDFAGIDVFYMVCQALQDRDVPVVISETHENLVEADAYGMKTGEGFYDYPSPGEYARVDIPRERRHEYNPYQMIASAVNAAAWLLDNDVTTMEDVDTAMRTGMSWPRGPLEFADEYGIDRIIELLERLHEETGREQYDPHPLLERMVEQGRLGWKTGEGFYEYDHETTSFGSVEYERREFVARIVLDRPDKLNAMDESAWRGLRAALEQARGDDDIRATIVEGSGRAFSAGDDIPEMAGWESSDECQEYLDEVLLPAIKAFRAHPKPTIALVDGIATGAGCELVLLSDLAVAGDGSRFGQPEGTIGALPPIWLAHGTTSVGKKKLLELATTGDLFTATEAHEMGLLNYAVDSEQAPDVARELARSTTASAPGSIESIKTIWNGVEDDLVDDWLATATDELAERLMSDEGRHGLEAFIEDETPRWER